MKASVTPWSSVVGTGVVVYEDDGRVAYMLSLLNVASVAFNAPRNRIKEEHLRVAGEVADALNRSFEDGKSS